MVRIADERYEPPPVPGAHSRGAPDIQLASYLLALRDALIETRKPPEEALDVLTATVHPRDPFSRTRFRENLARRLFYRPPDWVMTDVEVPGCYAFDVHHCVYADYLVGRAEAELCQRVLCDQDRRMAQRRGQPLLRAGTLAGGADRCDFRYIVRTGSDH